MIHKKKSNIKLPDQYCNFHKNPLFNFTLNRWYSIGFAKYEDMVEAGKNIKKYEDWKPEMERIADRALSEKRMMNAAIYYRSAEFFTNADDPDKVYFYDKFIDLFETAFKEDNYDRLKVPYENSFIPVLRISPTTKKRGTILLHGGMDSFIEEWYMMMKYLVDAGYEVLGFDGPGQGAALLKAGIPINICWEKPCSAILDYFNLDDVTLIGLSVGGWLCLRASGFEPRIKRVIASGHTIHYMDIPPAPIAWIFEYFMKYKDFFNKSALMKMKKNSRMRWEIGQTMHITQSKTPYEAAKKFNLALSRENMHADKVSQDVLFLSGNEDHFIPIRLHNRQIEALTNARSVTDRIFQKEEQAQNHCQIGNIGLSLDCMLEWLDGVK